MSKLFWFTKLKIFTLSKSNPIALVKTIKLTFSYFCKDEDSHFIPHTEIFIEPFYCFLNHHLLFPFVPCN